MAWPASETLALIEPHLPEALIPPGVLANVKSLARRLPDGLCSYYLECRLGDSPQVDFLVSAVVGADRQKWAGQPEQGGRDETLLDMAAWRTIGNFFRQWAQPATALYQHAPMIWLEFDGVHTPAAAPLPGVCFCLDQEYLKARPPIPQTGRLSDQVIQSVADEALALLYGHPISAQARQTLRACVEGLPARGRLIHVSAMLARRPPVIKLYVAVASEELPAYLTRIGWPGSSADLTAVVDTFCPALRLLFVDLTLGDALAPRVGLACSQVHLYDQSQRDPGWSALLDLCVAQGLCSPDKRAGLAGWPGATRHTFRGHSWPARLSRWLDLKIVYQPQRPLEVKAYLGFMPTFTVF